MICIAYYTEINLLVCKYAQKGHICRKIIEYASDKNPIELTPKKFISSKLKFSFRY